MGTSDGKAEPDRSFAGGHGRIHLWRESAIRLGRLVIEPGLRRVAHDDGREAFIEPRVMQVLVVLARSAGAIISRDDLVETCWHGVVVGEDAITRAIGRLRRLADGIGEGEFKIETHPKVGYRFVPLSPARAESPAATTVAQSPPAPNQPPPSDLAAEIPRDSGQIALHGERRLIYALVTDLDGFAEQARDLPPELVAEVLNAYVDGLSRAVVEHGGFIDKIVGDSLIAFWGAPVARPDDGERAARAAIAAWRVGEAFRTAPIGHRPPLGRTRVGLHRGDAIVGNFGGEGRAAYSALGEGVGTALDLESASKRLDAMVLASRAAICPSMRGAFRAMGRIRVRASTPLEVFEAALNFPPEATERLNAAYARFDAGEVGALGEISALAAQFPQDVALAGLLSRLQTAGPGGVSHLGRSAR
jgi:class 3 adenylate cyclase